MKVCVIRKKIREERTNISARFKQLAGIDKTLLIHDAVLRKVYEMLPLDKPDRQIGFSRGKD